MPSPPEPVLPTPPPPMETREHRLLDIAEPSGRPLGRLGKPWPPTTGPPLAQIESDHDLISIEPPQLSRTRGRLPSRGTWRVLRLGFPSSFVFAPIRQREPRTPSQEVQTPSDSLPSVPRYRDRTGSNRHRTESRIRAPDQWDT